MHRFHHHNHYGEDDKGLSLTCNLLSRKENTKIAMHCTACERTEHTAKRVKSYVVLITGPPTHNAVGQYCFARCASVVVCRRV